MKEAEKQSVKNITSVYSSHVTKEQREARLPGDSPSAVSSALQA